MLLAVSGLDCDAAARAGISNGIAAEINYLEPPTQIVSLNP
jgi:hypothetical protein